MSKQNLNKPAADTQNKSHRILAIVMAALSLLALFLPLRALAGSKVSTHISFGLLGQMIDTPHRRGGILPMFDTASVTTRLSSYAVYAFIFASIATLVFSIVAIVLAKKATPNTAKSTLFVKFAVYLFTFTNAAYTISQTALTAYATVPVAFDVTTILLTLLGGAAYLLLLYVDHGKKAWFYVAQFALSFLVLIIVMLAFTHKSEVSIALNVRRLYKAIALLCMRGMVAMVVAFSLCAFYPAKAYADVVIPLMITLVQVGVVLVVALTGVVAKIHVKHFAVYTLLAAVLSFVQLFGNCVFVLLAKKENAKNEAPAAEEKEEYIEVYPYQGGPVSGIYVAEVVEENTQAAPAPEYAQAAEYAEAPACEPATEAAPAEENNGIYDAFFATLTEEEKGQFYNLYVLKTLNMPGIPEYVVGGNNKLFFNKVFIYLGQYRQNIPNALLAKMYDFSLKL